MTTAAFVLALLLVAVGAGLIFMPAGLIVGGVLLAGCVVLLERAAGVGGDGQ